jgi:hypothetical protein
MSATIVTAADAKFFNLLVDLIQSCRNGPFAATLPIQVLDIGLTAEQRRYLSDNKINAIVPGWDVPVAWREALPVYFKSLYSRPYLPKYFPGHDLYLWIDADAWVQDDSVLPYFLRAAQAGKMAIVQETDRGYWTAYKPPKLWSQNHKAFAWAYGWKVGYRLGRNPILNGGVWALAADAPHWAAWQAALNRALLPRKSQPSIANMSFHIVEQTAQNYVVFGDRLPATFLPAYCNWFCGKGDPMFDPAAGLLVEPHEPHRRLGIVHLAGKGVKERIFKLVTPTGGTVETGLSYSAIARLKGAAEWGKR